MSSSIPVPVSVSATTAAQLRLFRRVLLAVVVLAAVLVAVAGRAPASVVDTPPAGVVTTAGQPAPASPLG